MVGRVGKVEKEREVRERIEVSKGRVLQIDFELQSLEIRNSFSLSLDSQHSKKQIANSEFTQKREEESENSDSFTTF